MKKKILGILVNLLVFAILCLSISSVFATKPVLLIANRQGVLPPLSAFGRMAGESDNRFVYLVADQAWTGDIVGIGTSEAVAFYASWVEGLPPSAQISTMRVRSFETIDSATVFGMYEGSLTLRLEYFRDLEKNYEGKWVIISGTEDLANLRGQGKFLPDGTLTGMVNFDP